MNKKKIFSLALVALLICTISFGTLAWFNATDEVTNTFKVADSDGNGTPNFSIDVNETPNTGFPGQRPEGDMPSSGTHDGGYLYENILPGSQLNKDAVVRNTGDYQQWVRVHLIFSDGNVWRNAISKAATAAQKDEMQFVVEDLFTELFQNRSRTIENNLDDRDDENLVFTLYYRDPLEAGHQFKVLDCIEIPGILVQDDMNFEEGVFSLKIKAEAVQVKNLNATNAFDAFKEVGWEVGSEYGE